MSRWSTTNTEWWN